MKTMMKKLTTLLLVMSLLVPFVGAQEQEPEPEQAATGKRFTPVVELSIPLGSWVVETDTDGKVHDMTSNPPYLGMFSGVTAKVGVAIKTLDMLWLSPMIKADYDAADETTNLFAGLGGMMAFSQDFKLNFGFGYAGSYREFPLGGTPHVFSGMHAMAGIDFKLPSAFLHVKAEDGFTLLADTTNKLDKKVNQDVLNNKVSANVVFNFFQFFMPDFEAGVYLDFKLNTGWARVNIKDKNAKIVALNNKVDFGLGLIMKPVDFLTVKTGMVLNADSSKSKAGTGSYSTPTKHNKFGMLMGAKVGFGKAALDFSYTPYFAGKDGKVAWENKIEHSVKLNLSYKY